MSNPDSDPGGAGRQRDRQLVGPLRLRCPPVGVVLLAVLAYLPAITAAPGRMPADSKLYLYLDPQRLVSDGFHGFDPRQFAGWVPHQHIAYLWPSGPWFSVFEIVGVPDWIAHRLWVGTIVFMAGLGVRWASRLLGLTAAGALAAAVVYQLSPYILPYVSRTSVMLLPWAGLGWIVGLTMLATLRSRWRHAAALALVVLTVGAVNATALLMIVPAPALWLLHAALSGLTTWRRALATAGRVTLLCAAVSVWWVTALVLQGRHGADVLAFSETLEAVSFTSLSTEVTRGLGYWLFYLRDPFAAATTAAVDHLASARTIAVGLLLVIVCITGLAATAWRERRYAVWLVVVGVVIAAGIHPIDRPSPVMSFVTGDGEAGLALALRSSTRAVPVSAFGLALGAGALVSALRRWPWPWQGSPRRSPPATARRRFGMHHVALVGVVLLATVGLPAAWTGGFVDPALERDQHPPDTWTTAAADLDAGPDGFRVLQVPGAEFGAFRWGYTVDQPLPGLTDVPLVTRDLLPLGSPAAMDLLYALDDRFQRGVLEPDAIAPIARLFGVSTVWLANDAAYDRFRTPRPDVVADALADGVTGLEAPRSFGDPEPNVPVVEMVDEQAVLLGAVPAALPPVQHLDVVDPVPVVRAKTDVVVVAGNGDGVVDAAAAGLLDGSELIRYAASFDVDELASVVADASLVIVTDTNRDRARHWRTSQDTVGFTQDGGAVDAPDRDVLRPVDGDARFELFDAGGTAHQTTAVQIGPVTARATAYGEPFAYRPERRAAMAVDGDLSTAWLVADRFDALGQQLVLDIAEPTERLTFRQPDTPDGARRITAVEIHVDDGAPVSFELDHRSLTGAGQEVPVDVPAGARITVTIAATAADPDHPDHAQAVGFAEVDAGLGPTTEVVRVPTDALHATGPDTPLTIVLTRERVRPTDRWRADPEPHMIRQLTLGHERTSVPEITVRLDQRADDEVLAGLFGIDAAVSTSRLAGSAAAAGWAVLDGRSDTGWISPFGSAVGTVVELRLDPDDPPQLLTVRQPVDGLHSVITAVRASDVNGTSVDAELTPPDGDGTATIDISGLTGSQVAIEITDVDARTTIDRRYGEPTVLPVSITAIEGAGLPAVTLPDEVDTGCRSDLVVVDDTPIEVRVRADVEALLAGAPVTAEPCGDATLRLEPGTTTLTTAPGARTGLHVDRVVLHSDGTDDGGATTGGAPPTPTTTVTSSGRTGRVVDVSDCTQGCWLVSGEGWNPAWVADLDGRRLPDPELVDGGFNGWWLPPSPGSRTVTITWAPQPVLTASLAASALAAAACIALVVGDRRRRRLPDPDRPDLRPLLLGRWAWPRGTRSPGRVALARGRVIAVVVAWCIVTALVIAPVWGLAPIPIGAVMVWRRTLRPAAVVAVVGAMAGSAVIVERVVRLRPLPDAAWVLHFDDLHRPGLFVVTALAASAALLDRRRDDGGDGNHGNRGEYHDDRLHRGPEAVRTVEHR